jgi:hypothetical protein
MPMGNPTLIFLEPSVAVILSSSQTASGNAAKKTDNAIFPTRFVRRSRRRMERKYSKSEK